MNTKHHGVYMKTVTFEELLQLPEGTLFADVGRDEAFFRMSIKGETLTDITYWRYDLHGDIELGYDDLMDKVSRGEDVPIDPFIGMVDRVYNYKKDQRFYVWSPEDVKTLIKALTVPPSQW